MGIGRRRVIVVRRIACSVRFARMRPRVLTRPWRSQMATLLPQMRARGLELLAVEIQGAQVVEAERLAGGVAKPPVLRERANRQAQGLVVIAHLLLHECQIVEQRGGIVRIGAFGACRNACWVIPLGVGVASAPQAARGQHLEALHFRRPVALGQRQRAGRGRLGLRIAIQAVLEVRRRARGAAR